MSNNFRPTATWENLRRRAELLRRLREFFDSHGFLEVETPVLSADTVVDRHLDPFAVNVSPLPKREGTVERFWLQTSPEFAMKRLLAAGGGRMYQVARVFRQDEIGPLHNPEFTLVEWYQPGEDYRAGMQLTGELCETLLGHKAASCATAWNKQCRAQPGCPALLVPSSGTPRDQRSRLYTDQISYGEAFDRYVGVNPHTAEIRELMTAVRTCGIEPPASLGPEDRDGWLDLLLVERVQPRLGVERPTILYDYPASQAALAQVRPGNPPVAERFELYVDGVELANGYHELLDPAELRARNARVNAQRLADGKPALPEESRLLAAMEAGLPPSVGVALGVDRLVMAALGAKNISEVIAFPADRA